MEITKSAMISVVGRPNVGKSTLTNRLVGTKVAIVSAKPQTTRTRITGVLNKDGCQYVFLDTPGLHKPRSRLGDYMVKVITDTVSEVDAAALVVEPIANIGPAEESLIGQIKSAGMPSVLVINKIDTIPREALLAVIACYAQAHDFHAVVPVSARTGEGMDELLSELEKFALEGPQLFPEDMVSDQPERQLIAEIIREKSLILLQREVPHGVAVGIERAFEFRACRLQAAVDFAESAAERRHRLVAASKQGHGLACKVHGFESVEKIGEIVLYVAVAPCGATQQYHIIVADARGGGICHVVNVGHVYAERTPDTVGCIGCISGRGSKKYSGLFHHSYFICRIFLTRDGNI